MAILRYMSRDGFRQEPIQIETGFWKSCGFPKCGQTKPYRVVRSLNALVTYPVTTLNKGFR